MRRGFATIEPFIVSPVILAIGFVISVTVRWLLGTTHWLTWIPTIVLALPFMFFFVFIPTMAIVTELKQRRKSSE